MHDPQLQGHLATMPKLVVSSLERWTCTASLVVAIYEGTGKNLKKKQPFWEKNQNEHLGAARTGLKDNRIRFELGDLSGSFFSGHGAIV